MSSEYLDNKFKKHFPCAELWVFYLFYIYIGFGGHTHIVLWIYYVVYVGIVEGWVKYSFSGCFVLGFILVFII